MCSALNVHWKKTDSLIRKQSFSVCTLYKWAMSDQSRIINLLLGSDLNEYGTVPFPEFWFNQRHGS